MCIRDSNKLKRKHSKLDGIHFDDLKPQEYLSDGRINLLQVKLLFKLRTRMFNCKQNFKNQNENENLFCKLCKVCIDSQSHLLNCFVLKNCNQDLRKNKSVKYEHIFEDVELQVNAITLLSKVIETSLTDILLEEKMN